MLELKSKYKQLITGVSPTLKDHGYKRRNSAFSIQNSGNWGIINFQKSTKSTADQIIFTVNLGIASSRLSNFFGVIYPDYGPNIYDCHWRKRLGRLIEANDKWWSIDCGSSIDEFGESISNYLLSSAIPEIAKYIDDQMLRDLWLSGKSPSLSEFQRLIHLSVFLKEIGPLELLESTLSKLIEISEGKSTAYTTELHLQKLLNY